MTARAFSRLEPISSPRDPARVVAGFFTLVAGIGALPGAYGTILLGALLFGALGEARFEGAVALSAALSYAILGFAQLWFYVRRAAGKHVKAARRWWLSTYFYNLVPLGVAIWKFIEEPHVGAVIAAVWFACLSALAIVAWANEPKRGTE